MANLGRPPRRLVMLNLDGSQDLLPAPGDPVTSAEGRTVGRLGTVAQHHEDGPIALALVKRPIGPDAPLLAGGVDARVDPADDDARRRAADVTAWTAPPSPTSAATDRDPALPGRPRPGSEGIR